MTENLPVVIENPIFADGGNAEFLRVATMKAEEKNFIARISDKISGIGTGVMGMLPDAVTSNLSGVSEKALKTAYMAGDEMPRLQGLSKFVAGTSGGISGFFGLSGMLVDVPLTTTIIMRAVRGVAREYGEDTSTEDCRMACLEVFGMNSGNDDSSKGYWGARAAVTSSAIDTAIKAIASRFSLNLSGKFAATALPVTGAVTGALINYSFTEHYIKMAHIHFSTRRLERLYGIRETRRRLREAAEKIR